MGTPGSEGLAAVADQALRSYLDRHPVDATYLGDHDRDHLLPDPSRAAADRRAGELRALLARLDALPPGDDLSAGDGDSGAASADRSVDAAVLRTVLAAELFDLEELREAEWNPMVHNPGGGLHALLSRDFAPVDVRFAALLERLRAVPEYLAGARERLGDVSAVHAATARDQLAGTDGLLDLAQRLASEHALALTGDLARAAEAVRGALDEHRRWLADGARTARDARIGEPLFADRLALTLDTAFDPQALLAEAERHLEQVGAAIGEEAGRLAGTSSPDATTVREVLDQLARDAPDDASVLGHCEAALGEATAFVRDRDLVTVFDDPVVVVAMPEIDRGVAVAYCRPNGPLEQAELPTEMAVSPTPAGWPADRVASFYREYNLHMLQDLTVHEAMPGHALQLMHSNRASVPTPVRRIWPSGSFVEGWAVYAEELMARHGYRSDRSEQAAGAVRMQQLKMQLRMTINAILDIRFHCDDLDEAAALDLMQHRGFQEIGEAAGKWRRVQLTSTQLCTYFVGYLETSRLVASLRSARPGLPERQLHDAVLAHGSPPPRHLRTLLGVPGDG